MTTTKNNVVIGLLDKTHQQQYLQHPGDSSCNALISSLIKQGLVTPDIAFPDFEQSAVKWFASPRRLAVHVKDVHAKAHNTVEHLKLMPITVALDGAGHATPALMKKISAIGLDASVVPTLRRAGDG